MDDTRLNPAAAEDLLRVSTLLVRFEGPDPWEQFLGDLLRWSAGRRTWQEAATDYLENDRFTEAARAVKEIGPAARAETTQRLMTRWQRWSQRQHERVERIQDEVGRLREQDGDGDFLDTATLHARKVVAQIQPLQTAMLPELVDMFGATSPATYKECEKDLGEAELHLELAREELEDRKRRVRQLLIEAKMGIDKVVNELLLDPERADDAERQSILASQALRAQDLAEMQRVQRNLDRLQSGESTHVTLPTPAPRSPQAAPRPRRTTRRAVSFHKLALSDLAYQNLARSPSAGGQAPEPPGDIAIGQRWSKPELDAIIKYAHQRLHPARGDGQGAPPRVVEAEPLAHPELSEEARQALGAYLAAQAMLYLLEGKFLNARTLFGDALGWVSWQQPNNAEVRMRLWHAPCTWGFTLTFLLPYLPEEEQARIFEKRNLTALFLHPFGELPLAVVEQHELMAEYGRLVLQLDPMAADELLRYFVMPYLREHPLAEQDFAAGLFRQSSPRISTLCHLIAALLEPLIPDVQAELRRIEGVISQSRSNDQSRFRNELRVLLGEHAQSSDLVEVMLEAMERLDVEQGEASDSVETSIISSLLNREPVAVPPDAPARLVLVASLPRGSSAIYGLRADVSLLDADDQPIPRALGIPSLVDCVQPGQRREIAVPITAAREQLGEARRLRVRYSRPAMGEQWRYVRAEYESYAVKLEAVERCDPRASLPYVVGVAVQHPDRIYGRREKVDEIFSYLHGREQDNVVLVLGDRRIGKTTLLNAVKEDERRKARYPLFVQQDQQDLDDEPRTFFGRLVNEVQRTLADRDLPVHGQVREQLDRDPGYAFRSFMKSVDHDMDARNLRMLVVLDEFEKVYEKVQSSVLPQEVVASIRATIQECRRISFILAGVTDVLRPHISSPHDRLFKLAFEVRLDALAPEAARKLIVEPVADDYTVAVPAAVYLAAQTGGQPYLLQRICAELFRHMTRRQAKLATVLDIEEVLAQSVLPDSSFFSYLIAPWRDRQVFSLLKAMAHLQSGERFVSVADIRRRLIRTGAEWSEDIIIERLMELCEQVRTVVERGPNLKTGFRLKVGLLARHLQWLDRTQSSLVLRV